MNGSMQNLEMRLQRLEKRNRLQTAIIALTAVMWLAVGCERSGQSVFRGNDGVSRLEVSADGLTFYDQAGSVEAQLTAGELRLSGSADRSLRVYCDSAGAGMSILKGDAERVVLRSDDDETEMVFFDLSNVRRSTLSARSKLTSFALEGPSEDCGIQLHCENGKTRIIQVPKSK